MTDAPRQGLLRLDTARSSFLARLGVPAHFFLLLVFGRDPSGPCIRRDVPAQVAHASSEFVIRDSAVVMTVIAESLNSPSCD